MRVVCVLCVLVCVLLPILTHVIRVFIKWTSGGAERAAYVRTTYSILNVRTFRVMVDGRLITVVPLGTVD